MPVSRQVTWESFVRLLPLVPIKVIGTHTLNFKPIFIVTNCWGTPVPVGVWNSKPWSYSSTTYKFEGAAPPGRPKYGLSKKKLFWVGQKVKIHISNFVVSEPKFSELFRLTCLTFRHAWIRQLEVDVVVGLTADVAWDMASDRQVWTAQRPVAGQAVQ